MKIGFKVRIYPNKEQESKLFYFCKCSHEMWNYVVAKYKNSGEKIIKIKKRLEVSLNMCV